MGSDPQANSRNSTRNALNKHPSSDGSFAFARLRCHRLLVTGLVNERIIANALNRPIRGSGGQREGKSLTSLVTRTVLVG
jgi:hypothetical protein